jgi:hypothetical protein
LLHVESNFSCSFIIQALLYMLYYNVFFKTVPLWVLLWNFEHNLKKEMYRIQIIYFYKMTEMKLTKYWSRLNIILL